MQSGAAVDDPQRVERQGVVWRKRGGGIRRPYSRFAPEKCHFTARFLGEHFRVLWAECQRTIKQVYGLGMIGVIRGQDAQ